MPKCDGKCIHIFLIIMCVCRAQSQTEKWYGVAAATQKVVRHSPDQPYCLQLGSHWELNPMPPTLGVDALTTELRLPCSNPSTCTVQVHVHVLMPERI